MTATIGETATLAHGYTMGQIQRLVNTAARSYRPVALDPSERWESAWFGVIEMLYSHDEKPSTGMLVNAGKDAVRKAVTDQLHHHGITQVGLKEAPKFSQYWLPVASTGEGFTEQLTERLALPQLLSVLTADEYDVIATLAACQSPTAAREALGLSQPVYTRRLRSARAKLIELWFEHETPPQPVDTDVMCRSYHLRTKYGSKSTDGRWKCSKCIARVHAKKHRSKPSKLVERSLAS